ncbi:DUF4760 domain-containing protein [Oscillibacter valericigenes]|nr:DUF4760 domain-containing protein [Oscillibacter valericigenes]
MCTFDIVSLIVSILGTFTSILAAIYAIRAYHFATTTYKENIEREKIRATVSDFPALRRENEELQTKLKELPENEREAVLKSYVAQMERFAVGVNSGAYSLDIVNRMSGGILVQQYKKIIKDFIKHRREDREHPEVKTPYSEYVKMMQDLYGLRGKEWES